MNIQRGRVVSGGRVQLPADVRRALALSDGDTVLIEMVGGEIRLRPLRGAVSRVQDQLSPYRSAQASVVDELIEERRAAAKDE